MKSLLGQARAVISLTYFIILNEVCFPCLQFGFNAKVEVHLRPVKKHEKAENTESTEKVRTKKIKSTENRPCIHVGYGKGLKLQLN